MFLPNFSLNWAQSFRHRDVVSRSTIDVTLEKGFDDTIYNAIGFSTLDKRKPERKVIRVDFTVNNNYS